MSQRLHIAHFTNTYHPLVSGVVRSVSTFRQALVELGHQVFIFAQDAGDYEDEEPFIFRFPAIDLPAMHDFPLSIPFSPFVDKLIPSLKLDVIHSHHPFLLGHSAAHRADDLGLPLVFTFHTRYRDYSHYVGFNQEWVKHTIDRIISDYMRRCQHIVVPSESMRQVIEETYGVTDRLTVVPTGIDLAPYRLADGPAVRQQRGWGEDKILISVGRLAQEKNWPTLLAAARQVLKQRDDVRLVIVGEGEERENLEKLAYQTGLAERIEFTGLLPMDQVTAYLKAADLFCFASVTETQGLVTMEALAAGLPVVAVDATGTRDEISHEQEGLLTENDSQALAQAIERALADQNLYQKMRAAAEKKAQTLESTVQAKKLVTVYEQAIADKKADLVVPVEAHQPMFELVKNQWRQITGGEKKAET